MITVQRVTSNEQNEPEAATSATQDQLNQIVEQISTQTDNLATGVRTTVEAARRIGVYLTEAKKLLKETETAFEAWVGEHCRFSYITACRYVRLAEKWGQFTDQEKSTLTIPQLLALVAGHRRTPRSGGRQPEAERQDADRSEAVALVRPAVFVASPDSAVMPARHVGVGTNIQEDGPEARSQSREDARPIRVSYAQVQQAAVKHRLDGLLASVPTDRLAGFLAELGVVVKSDPVPAAP